jgi:intracellular sulfur oxidation DsrE/DsrF family protein
LAASTVITIDKNGMGSTEQALAHTLITSYLSSLAEEHNWHPAAICFYADGVKLTVTGSPVLEPLQKLEDRGVKLFICSTCLNYFNLRDEVQVGIVGGMHDIMQAQWQADKIISL